MMAYDTLDTDGSGVVTRADVLAVYDTSKHPEVLAGKKTRDEVITEFMAQWETDKADGTVTRDEFLDYYKGACGCRAGVVLARPRMCVRMSVLPSAPFASAVFALCGA